MFVSIIKSHATAPGAYRITATLIREWPELKITDAQLKVLLEYARVNLDAPQGQTLTFSLIRSLLSKGIVLLQLFELMRAVRSAMITSHSQATRQQCRSAYILHLLHTPMATKRVEEELDFCLANLCYEFPAGRASVALLMEALASKLPIDVVDCVAEAWFVALAAQLAKELTSSDGAEEARLAISAALRALVARLPEGKRRENLTLLLTKWILSGGKAAVQLAAWKICALKAELFLSEEILDRGIEVMEHVDEAPGVLLVAVIEALRVADLTGEQARKVASAASQSFYFRLDTDIQVRHQISLLWKCLLKREEN
jgi:U3 small nucleolar RNA-associated protein 20